ALINITQMDEYKLKIINKCKKKSIDIIAGRKQIEVEDVPTTFAEDLVDDMQFLDSQTNLCKYDRGWWNNLVEVFNPPQTWKVYRDMINKKKKEIKNEEKLRKKGKLPEKELKQEKIDDDSMVLRDGKKVYSTSSQKKIDIDIPTEIQSQTTNPNKYPSQSSTLFKEKLNSLSKMPLSFSSYFPDRFANRNLFHWMSDITPKQKEAHEKEREERLKRNQKKEEKLKNTENSPQINTEEIQISNFNDWLEIYIKLREEAISDGLKEDEPQLDEKDKDNKTHSKKA
ncbi:MAG: hypothetical protein EZS28_033091, partial [Streblomastix strix]